MSKKKKLKASQSVDKSQKQPVPEIATKQGVLVVPLTGEDMGQPESTDIFASLTALKVPADLFDQQNWMESSVSRALGLPLKVTRWPCQNARLANKFAQGLFLYPDPEVNEFGCVKFRRMDGAVFLARVDEQSIAQTEVESLLVYLSTTATEVTNAVRAERDVRRQKLKDRMIDMQSSEQAEKDAQAEGEVQEEKMQGQLDGQDEREDEVPQAPEAPDAPKEVKIPERTQEQIERDEEDDAEWAGKKWEMAQRLLSEKAYLDFAMQRAMTAA